MPTYKFASNLPVKVELGYIDIVPSEKGGPQVRFKGTIDGEPKTYAYLPGKLEDQISALISAGIISNKEYPTEVEKPFEVKPLKKSFSMVKDQPAGDKYGTFKVVNGNGGTSVATAPAAGPSSSVGSAAGAAPLTPELLLAEKAKYCTAMKQANAYVIDNIRPKFEGAKIPLNDETVYKFAFSIWQKWCEHGLVQ